METLLLLTYGAICYFIFKVFKVPVNKWTVPTAVLGGVVLVGALVTLMNYNHPYSERVRKYAVTTPIVPTVNGRVIEVPVTANVMLEQGDVLFRLDDTQYKAKVESLTAQLTSAQEDLERATKLASTGAGPRRNQDIAQANVDDLTAQLMGAQDNLDETVVRAPTRGYVTQLFLHPGMMAVSLPLRPVMVFVHQEEDLFAGWFRQNNLLRIDVGSEAEIAFDSIPGEVFTGRVTRVLPATFEGQLQPTGNLMTDHNMPGRIPVTIEITDPDFEPYRGQVPGGAFGQAAVYSEHVHHVAIMRKILLRMAAWLNYFFPFH
ncbi:HlyD family secretion protein [Ketobacter sp.]|uniref:HlyD family secretion protein n=1 Tax=Ketobacter sp. TaxID=2083498 RepID=UPI000F2696D8|nr:biotin/lipoyl-binding protein [Ketobacter sp.]RLT93802.1 MAG: HlyD family secretion protein [Ketobacter sp.]